jgi:transcription elongation factor Elf1
MLGTKRVDCPYCGEQIEVVIDLSIDHQAYVEDCQVCCRPIDVDVTVSLAGDAMVIVSHENES